VTFRPGISSQHFPGAKTQRWHVAVCCVRVRVFIQEESIITAAIEERTAAARAEESRAASSSRHASRPRAAGHSSLLDGTFDAFDTEFGHMSVLDDRMRPPKLPGGGKSRAGWRSAAGAGAGGDQSQQQQQEGQEDEEEQEQEDRAEQETLHRLCPTYASDVNSPLRHVRTRIYFTSESHIHSLVNVLRYCHLACPSSSGSGLAGSCSAAASMSKAPSSSNAVATAAVAAAAAGSAAAAATVQADGAVVATVAAAAAAGGGSSSSEGSASQQAVVVSAGTTTQTPTAAAGVAGAGSDAKSTAFASSAAGQAAAAAAAAGGGGESAAAAVGSASGEAALQAVSSVSSSTAGVGPQQPQQLLTPEGQNLLENTDEFDYLTHIVFRMYENKMVSVCDLQWVGGGVVGGGELTRERCTRFDRL